MSGDMHASTHRLPVTSGGPQTRGKEISTTHGLSLWTWRHAPLGPGARWGCSAPGQQLLPGLPSPLQTEKTFRPPPTAGTDFPTDKLRWANCNVIFL